MSKQVFLILLITVVTQLMAGCDFSQTSYGGSEPLTLDVLAKRVLASSNLVLRVDSSHVTLSAGDVTKIINQVVSFQDATAPVDLAPDVAGLATVSSGFLHFAPAGSGTFFSTPTAKQLLFPSATIFLVMKATSTGDLVSINPQDRVRQAFQLSTNATNITAKFFSSGVDISQTSAPVTSGTIVIGASFPTDSAGIDLSVNGHLASAPTQTGSLNPALEIGRIISVGPAQAGDVSDIKEILIFNRALTRSEHGAILSYLANENSLSINLDPSLSAVYLTAPTDANFAPAQAVIENKCTQCHTVWAGAAASYYLSEGLIVKGDPLNSRLYYRLQGSAGSNGPKIMPQNSSISADDRDLIKTWITNAK